MLRVPVQVRSVPPQCNINMLTDYHNGSGIIRYDPPRPGMKRRTKWWCVLYVDKEITRYYRWWIQRMLHIQLHPPSWDAHISIIRGEKPGTDLEHLWKKYDGMRVPFKYHHSPKPTIKKADDVGNFWYIDVVCPKIQEIREEFGFPTNFGYHLTVGRSWV